MSSSMTDSLEFKDIVKQQADIVRIVGEYVKLRKSGAQNYSGLCPFHNENTPSFSVHATLQFFHCFGCGVSGDVFTFIQKIENVTFPEAVRAVAQKLGIPLPKLSYNSPAEAEEAKLRTVLLDVHERAVAFLSGVFAPSRRRPRARIPSRTGPQPGSDQSFSYWLRARFGVFLERPAQGRVRRGNLAG